MHAQMLFTTYLSMRAQQLRPTVSSAYNYQKTITASCPGGVLREPAIFITLFALFIAFC